MLSAKKYWSMLLISMQQSFAYRFNFFVNLISGVVFITALFYIWKAIFLQRTELAGMSWDDMKSYLFVVFITNTLLTWYSETAIARKVMDGSVAMDLLKPINFQKARLSETLGTSIIEGGLGLIFAVLWAIFIAEVSLPSSYLTSFYFIISILLSILIKFGIVYITGLLCFYTTSLLGVAWARAAITNLLSGALIPIALFPDWLYTLSKILPFQGIVTIPASIYMGKLTGVDLWLQLALQLGWVIILWYCGKALWKWAIRQVTIHGG